MTFSVYEDAILNFIIIILFIVAKTDRCLTFLNFLQEITYYNDIGLYIAQKNICGFTRHNGKQGKIGKKNICRP